MDTNYKIAQARLYLACRVILNSTRLYLPKFTNHKAKYTPAWITAFLGEILAAELLPDEQARALTHESLRREVLEVGDKALSAWKGLKRYIYDAYSVPEPEYRSAGWGYYDAAANEGFEELSQLMIEGLKYINSHEAVLMENENMPSTYKEEFEIAKANFDEKLALFYAAEEQAIVDTVTKITANNALYAKIIALCLDGQFIFEKEEAKSRQFSFSNVCQLISPAGASEVQFELTNEETGLPVIGEIIHVGSDKVIVTGADGRGLMTQLSSGDNSFRIVVDGFNEKLLTLTLNGTKKTEHVHLQPLFTGELSESPSPAPEETPAETPVVNE